MKSPSLFPRLLFIVDYCIYTSLSLRSYLPYNLEEQFNLVTPETTFYYFNASFLFIHIHLQ